MSEITSEEGYFVVTSGGRAATYWLSHLLNQSSEIFCMHGYFPVSELPHGEKNAPDEFGKSGYQIGNIHDLDGSAKSRREWAEILRGQWEYFESLSFDAYFDEAKTAHQVKVYGNIHGYTYDSLIRRMKKDPPKYNVQFCNLTRHPVARAQSFFKRFSHISQWIPESPEIIAARKLSLRKLQYDVMSRFNINIFDDDKWLFADTINRMLIQYAEAMIEVIPHIRSEEITSDKEKFKQLFSYLTGGKVELSDEILGAKTFSTRLNRTLEEPVSPSAIYSEWKPWQQYVFRYLVQPEWLKAYERIGYDISFVNSEN